MDAFRVQQGLHFRRLGGVVVGDADVEGTSAAHDLFQGARRLFERGVGVRAVVVEDVHVIHAHALQRLVQAGDQVLATAVVAIRPWPHVVAGFGRNDQFVTVGLPVLLEMNAEIALRFSVGRAVIIGQVKVGDAVVEGCPEQALLDLEGRDVSEIVPQPQRNGGEQNAAAAAAPVGHRVIARLICLVVVHTRLN